MKLPLALTLGDPVGIGPEIVAQVIADYTDRPGHRIIAIGDTSAMQAAVAACGLDKQVRTISDWSVAAEPGTIDVFDTGSLGDLTPGTPELPWGKVDARAGRAAVAAIELGAKAALDGHIAGIVTGPINKEAIWQSGSEHLGHTEMLGALTGVTKQDTMFVVKSPTGHPLRIFFATRHMSLRQAVDKISVEGQLQSIRTAIAALKVYGVDEPRLAVAALNPHGGENGAFGNEEIDFIRPACDQARAEGLDVSGPIPADAVFHQGLQGRFDGVLSQYHDQGHIASKTYDFDGTISVTVGLPILRTSVDHGTAFDIAGQGIADPGTMRSAYLAGVDYAPYVPAIREAYLPR